MAVLFDLDVFFSKQPTLGKNKIESSSLCRCHKVTVHQDDCEINNACGLFSVTHPGVIGAAPFSVWSVLLTACFLFPPILSFLILCLLLSAFVPGERPFSFWTAAL